MNNKKLSESFYAEAFALLRVVDPLRARVVATYSWAAATPDRSEEILKIAKEVDLPAAGTFASQAAALNEIARRYMEQALIGNADYSEYNAVNKLCGRKAKVLNRMNEAVDKALQYGMPPHIPTVMEPAAPLNPNNPPVQADHIRAFLSAGYEMEKRIKDVITIVSGRGNIFEKGWFFGGANPLERDLMEESQGKVKQLTKVSELLSGMARPLLNGAKPGDQRNPRVFAHNQ